MISQFFRSVNQVYQKLWQLILQPRSGVLSLFLVLLLIIFLALGLLVVVSGVLQPNQSPVMSVTVTNNTDQVAYVYGYLDLNGDDDWNDAGEVAMISVLANSGTQTVTMLFDGVITTSDQLYGRFRLSTDETAVSSPTGLAPNGEVEDYVFRIEPTAISLTQSSAAATNFVSLIALFSIATVGTLGVMARRRQEG